MHIKIKQRTSSKKKQIVLLQNTQAVTEQKRTISFA